MAHSEGQARQEPVEAYCPAGHEEQAATPISVGVGAAQAQLVGVMASGTLVGGQVRQF